MCWKFLSLFHLVGSKHCTKVNSPNLMVLLFLVVLQMARWGIQYHLCNTFICVVNMWLWWLPGGCGRNLCQWRSVSTACFSCQWKCLFYFHHDGSWSLLSKHLLISSWQYLTSLPGLSRFYHLFVFAVLNVCDQRKIGQTWEHSSWSGHEVGKGTMFKYASPKLGECLNATNACLVPYLWLHFCVTQTRGARPRNKYKGFSILSWQQQAFL